MSPQKLRKEKKTKSIVKTRQRKQKKIPVCSVQHWTGVGRSAWLTSLHFEIWKLSRSTGTVTAASCSSVSLPLCIDSRYKKNYHMQSCKKMSVSFWVEQCWFGFWETTAIGAICFVMTGRFQNPLLSEPLQHGTRNTSSQIQLLQLALQPQKHMERAYMLTIFWSL